MRERATGRRLDSEHEARRAEPGAPFQVARISGRRAQVVGLEGGGLIDCACLERP